jgi:hypothetical protein
MKRIALALILAATVVQAETYPYEVAFNAHGFSVGQTATMSGQDMAIVWFITPDSGRYLIQVGSASDSAAIQHLVVLNDGTAAIAVQQGFAPSFYVTIGTDLKANTPYFLYISNAKGNGNPSCKVGMVCNVTILTQPAS